MPDYDAIIIGAGNGGLASAATLAKNGSKVLLLEKHNIPGGCATSFCRGRFEFEVALHQLSGMGTAEKPGPLRRIFKKLEIEDEIDWVELENLYRVVLPGELDITLRADRESAIATLQERFPDEKDNIRAFYDLVYRFIMESVGVSRTPESDVTEDKFPAYFKYSLKSSQEVLDEFFKDPLLQLSLNVYWSFMGMYPERLPFSILAGNIFIYMEFKPFHLKGGSQVLSNALVNTILENGGDVRFNTEATKINLADGRVKSVTTAEGDVFTSDYIISNISTIHTYVNLLDSEQVPESAVNDLKKSAIGPSAFTLYIGLDCEPSEVGIEESMNVMYGINDVNKSFQATKELDIENDGMIVSCYTLDDPHFSPAGTSQVVVVCLKYAEPWMELSPDQYYETKYRCADSMLKRVENLFPGFREHIEEMEVATPLTHMRYLNHPGGAIYGFEQQMKDVGFFLSPKSPIEGLFFAGGWVDTCGFQPSLTSGYNAAKAVMKKSGRGA